MIKIITTCNDPYFYNLRRFFFALEKIFTSYELYVHGVNLCKHDLKHNIFKRKNVYLIKHKLNFKNFEHERGYCSNLRASALFNCAKKSKKNDILVYIDVNCIVMKKFAIFLKNMNTDIAIAIDENHPCYNKSETSRWFWPQGPFLTPFYGVAIGGVQVFRISKKTVIFLKRFSDLVSKKILSWYADQEAVFILYMKFKNILTNTNIINQITIGSKPVHSTLILYKKGGANNQFFDDYSYDIYKNNLFTKYKSLKNSSKLYKKVENLSFIKKVRLRIFNIFKK